MTDTLTHAHAGSALRHSHLRLVPAASTRDLFAAVPIATHRMVLAGWRPVSEPRVRASAWAGLLEQMWPGEALRLVHTLRRSGHEPEAYTLALDLLQPLSARGSQTPIAMRQALVSLLPGQEFNTAPCNTEEAAEPLPLRAIVTPASVLLAQRRSGSGSAAVHFDPLPRTVPFPVDLPSWALTVPFDEPLADSLQLQVQICAEELDDTRRQQWHELLRRLRSGNVRAFQPGAPMSEECADRGLREAVEALLQSWLRQPVVGFTLRLAIRSTGDLSAFVLRRIARDVLGRMPFELVLSSDEADLHAPRSPLLRPGQGMPGLFAPENRLAAFGVPEIVPPPTALPEDPGSVIGHAGRDTPVVIPDALRLMHVAVDGGSGTGKSNFMLRMLTEDIRRGFGAGVIDVHGGLCDSALALLRPEDHHRVVFVDIEDSDFSVALNPMHGTQDNPDLQNYVANQILEIIEHHFETPDSTGPKMRNNAKHALIAAMGHPEGGTLADAARVFEDPAFRRWLLSRANRQTADYFKAFVATDGEHGFNNWLPYMLARFHPFVMNRKLRRMLCRPSTLNLRQAMDEGWLLFFRLSKSALQELECSLLGTLLLLQFQVAALSRANVPESQRRPFYLYVDEFHTFANDSTPALFREARKFGLGLTVATQSLSSLRHRKGGELTNAVLANTATKALFRLSPLDARMLEDYVAPEFTARDLSRTPNYQAVLSVAGSDMTAFRVRAALPQPVDTPVCIRSLRQASGLRHGTPLAEADAMLARRELPPPDPAIR